MCPGVGQPVARDRGAFGGVCAVCGEHTFTYTDDPDDKHEPVRAADHYPPAPEGAPPVTDDNGPTLPGRDEMLDNIKAFMGGDPWPDAPIATLPIDKAVGFVAKPAGDLEPGAMVVLAQDAIDLFNANEAINRERQLVALARRIASDVAAQEAAHGEVRTVLVRTGLDGLFAELRAFLARHYPDGGA